MRDTRKARDILIIALTAGIGAVLGERFLKPVLNNTLKGKGR